MGIYLFSKEVLLEELEQDARSVSDHDFGKNVIPQMLRNKRQVFAYDFVNDQGQPKYWRDIGTRDAYYQTNMDLVRPVPEFNLFDKQWPVRTLHEQYPPVRTFSVQEEGVSHIGTIEDSLIAGGCVIKGAQVTRSVLSPNVCVENGAQVLDSVVMEGALIGAHAKIRQAIIDKYVVIPPFARIGYDLELDRQRFAVTTSGIAIVPKRTVVRE